MTTTLHLCIATGQNTANFIPLKQLAAHTIWILETPDMQKQQSAKALSTALKSALPEAQIRTLAFDDSTPQAMQAAALQLACDELDGKDVVFVRDGDTYTARPVKLGDRDSTQVAVLEGVKAGEDIVVTQSYLVKADIEKAGASHAH